MKKLGFLTLAVFITVTSISCNGNAAEESVEAKTTKTEVKAVPVETETAKVIVLSEAKFKELVWDYDASPQEWKYKGKLPAVIDFYADWCGPCKRVAPIMEKLSKEYDGRIIIYKVNTDQNRELSGVFGIKSIPSILFIPKEGQPAMQAGAMSEEQYKNIFEEFILGNKTKKQ